MAEIKLRGSHEEGVVRSIMDEPGIVCMGMPDLKPTLFISDTAQPDEELQQGVSIDVKSVPGGLPENCYVLTPEEAIGACENADTAHGLYFIVVVSGEAMYRPAMFGGHPEIVRSFIDLAIELRDLIDARFRTGA